MAHQQQCNGCEHSNTCETIYRQLGQSDAPPVACKVFAAFVLPILSFVITLALSEHILEDRMDPKWIQLTGVVIAIAASVLVVVVSSFLMKAPQTKRMKETS
jgi:hypothetical protein